MTRTSWVTAAALLITLVPTLAACGDDAPADTAPAERTAANGDTYNDADVAFATEMIPHHADALVMVDMTQGRDLSPELTTLTEQIRDAQAPEIERMVDWLTAWKVEVPETSRDHANSHDMSDTDDDLSALEDSEGSAFEAMWLEMMIGHHVGAVEMARAALADGLFRDAVDLAESIETSHSAEIDQMQDLLAG